MCLWICITWFGGGTSHQVSDQSHDGQSHDAGHTEDHSHQAVVEAGGVAADPGMVEGWRDGQRVHAQGHPYVGHSQVDGEQLGGFESLLALGGSNEHSSIAQDRQHSWIDNSTDISATSVCVCFCCVYVCVLCVFMTTWARPPSRDLSAFLCDIWKCLSLPPVRLIVHFGKKGQSLKKAIFFPRQAHCNQTAQSYCIIDLK